MAPIRVGGIQVEMKPEEKVFETIYETLAGNTQYPQFNPKNVEDIEIDYDKKRIYLLYREKEWGLKESASVPLMLKLEKPRCSDLNAFQLRTLLCSQGVIRHSEAEEMDAQELENLCKEKVMR